MARRKCDDGKYLRGKNNGSIYNHARRLVYHNCTCCIPSCSYSLSADTIIN